MAKIKLGATIGDARNKAGAIVYSKNQFGAYIRQKVSPVQPNTARQTLVRQLFTTLSVRWANTLTDAQRLAWASLAAANPVVDVFGDSQVLSGIQFYQRVNRNLQETGFNIIDAAPANQAVDPLVSFTPTADGTLQTVTLAFTATPLTAAHVMVVRATPPLNPGRSFFKPFLRKIGASADAQVSPFAAGAIYIAKFGAFAVGQRLGFAVHIVNGSNGAASPAMFGNAIATA